MRALSVRQPWADLILSGVKDVENRTWPVPSTMPQWGECDYHGRTPPDQLEFVESPTGDYWRHWPDDYQCPVTLDGPFPLRIGVHASQQLDYAAGLERYTQVHGVQGSMLTLLSTRDVRRGALIGFVTVTGCHDARDCMPVERWSDDPENERHVVVERAAGCSPWADPPSGYHWTLSDPDPLEVPVPMRGSLGLWRLDAEVAS